MKRCPKHIWLKEEVEVKPRAKLKAGSINRAYLKPISVDICLRCDKIKNRK